MAGVFLDYRRKCCFVVAGSVVAVVGIVVEVGAIVDVVKVLDWTVFYDIPIPR